MVVMAPSYKFNKMKPSKKALDAEEPQSEPEPETEELSDEVRVIAQEVRIVQNLANNDLVTRNRQMKKLKKWLELRAKSSFPFAEDDFMRIWKGMYYHFWLSDKPLVQEALAEEMSNLVGCFDANVDLSVNFFGAFMKTMCQQWFGMDQWRIDKYMMLVRRMLRAVFYVLKENSWDKNAIEKFNEHMLETILGTETNALGLAMHYFDIFFEELAKVSNGDINEEQVAEFVKPFVKFLAYQTDFKLLEHCKKKVFFHLLFQSSLGREYQDKFTAWRQMGFPTRSIHELEKVTKDTEENDEDNEDESDDGNGKANSKKQKNKELDPRAGNVDVFVAELPLNGEYIIKEFEDLLNKYDLTTKRRKMLRKVLDLYKRYHQGVFPLGVKTMPRFEAKSEKPLIKSKIDDLENLENDLFGIERKLKKLTKRKRRQLLKSINYDEVNEDNIEEIIEKALPKHLQKFKEAQRSLMKGWTEEELDESEIPKKKAKQNEQKLEKNQNKAQNKRQQKTEEFVEESADEEPTNKQSKLENGNVKKKKTQILKKKENGEEVVVVGGTKKDSKVKTTTGKETQTANSSETPTKILTKQVQTPRTVGSEIKDEKKSPTTSAITTQENDTTIPAETPLTPASSHTKSSNNNQTTIETTTPASAPTMRLPKVLKISTCDDDLTPKKPKPSPNKRESEWDTPLGEGEIEYFLPSTKMRLKQVNERLNALTMSTPIRQMNSSLNITPGGGSSTKKVKIALKHNTSQNPSEYIKQVKSSPSVPYDASKKPTKGLLKPNAAPGPINPFYKKKIGLKLLNDTI